MIRQLGLLLAILSLLKLHHSNAESPSSSFWQLAPGATAVVTGGTKGIGKAIVDELGAKGAKILTCARNSDELEKCVESWKADGFDVTGVTADMASSEGRDNLMTEIKNWLGEVGRLDILVNNVGTNIRKPSIEYTEEDIQKVFNTNLHSFMALTTACHPLLKRKEGEDSSSVINIGSVAGGTYRVLERLLLLWSRKLLTIFQSLALKLGRPMPRPRLP
jgi:Tropinone reductase 1